MKLVQQQSFPISEFRLISRAKRPLGKSAPNSMLDLALAGLAGLILGGGLGILRDISDRVFRTPAQIEEHLRADCISLVPLANYASATAREASASASAASAKENFRSAQEISTAVQEASASANNASTSTDEAPTSAMPASASAKAACSSAQAASSPAQDASPSAPEASARPNFPPNFRLRTGSFRVRAGCFRVSKGRFPVRGCRSATQKGGVTWPAYHRA